MTSPATRAGCRRCLFLRLWPLSRGSGFYLIEMANPSPEIPGIRTRPEPPAYSAARTLLGLTLFAVPLPFGAVYTWAWASLTILTLLVLILWMVGSLQVGKMTIGYTPLYAPIALFLALGLMQLSFHLTLTPIATRESLLKLATDFALF